MKKSDIKIKLSASIILLAVNAICALIVYLTPLETTVMKVAGSFAAVFLVSLAVFFFPRRFYLFTMGFLVLATSFGSVLNLYRYVGMYDLFVHYLSGILLAEGGIVIIEYIAKKRSISHDSFVFLVFSFFFSSACAAFWEIYEFTADNLISADMQGSKANTMGDIIAGVLGAATYFVIALLILRKKNKSNKIIPHN